jgi:hypothetical protein
MLKLWTALQALDHHTMARDNILLIHSHLVDINQTVAYSDMWCHQCDELMLSIQMMLYL